MKSRTSKQMKNILKDVEIRFFVEFKSLSRFQGVQERGDRIEWRVKSGKWDTYRFHNVKVLELS